MFVTLGESTRFNIPPKEARTKCAAEQLETATVLSGGGI